MPGLYAGNVRREPSTYAITPASVGKDGTCIAMTRSVGDFYAVPFGLTCEPSVKFYRLSQEEIHDGVHVCVATDGIWDCWKYPDFAKMLNDMVRDESLSTIAVGQQLLSKSYFNACLNFGTKQLDDATLVMWRM